MSNMELDTYLRGHDEDLFFSCKYSLTSQAITKIMKTTPSPCVRNCCLNDDNICLGCFRSIDEIMQWSKIDEAEKQRIIKLCHTRRKTHTLKFKPLP